MKRVRVVVLGYRELSGLWSTEAHAQTALALGFYRSYGRPCTMCLCSSTKTPRFATWG